MGQGPEVNLIKFYKLQVQLLFSDSKAWFKRQTLHEPDLIHWIKYLKKSLASESMPVSISDSSAILPT